MALTETQREDVATILGVAALEVESQIIYLGSRLTAVKEARIAVEIARWNSAKTKFYKVHPKEANFGAEIDSSDEKDDIRNNLAVLFERNGWKGAGSSNTFAILR